IFGGRLGVRRRVPADLAPFHRLVDQLLLSVGADFHRSSKSRHESTSSSGSSTPIACSRLMIACTPGNDVLPTCSATKLMRAINEPLLIHSWPVCQPSTDGGLSRSWPI